MSCQISYILLFAHYCNLYYPSRQKPSTNTSTLSVANAIAGAGSIGGDMASNTNVAIEEVNSNASGTDE